METTSLKNRITNYKLPASPAGRQITNWIKKNRLEAFVLAITLLVGAFMRLYRIDEYMTFLGDEGRDAIVVRRLLVNFDPILIGPRTSIGDMYLGPLYYYLIAPFLLLANFSPVGPAVMIALLGITTIFFVWLVAREFFSRGNVQGTTLNISGLVASSLYAISPVVITYSRSSWNPNIMPFFALLSIYSIWKVWSSSAKASGGQADFRWLMVMGVSMAFVLQSHYLGLLLIPTLGLFWIISLLKIYGSRITDHGSRLRNFIKNSFIGLGLFLLLMSPLVAFDARHDWRNFAAMRRFFTERQTTVSARPWTAIPELPEVTNKMVTRLIAGTNQMHGLRMGYAFLTILTIMTVTMIYIIVTKKRFTKTQKAYLLLLIWIGVGLVGLALYKQEIYDHYYGFFFATPFLIIGGLAQSLINKSRFLGGLPVFLAASYLLLVNLQNNPLKYPPNRQMQHSIEVSKKIITESDGKKFNLAVLAERNYEGAYQYFLEKENAPIVMIDPLRFEETKTEQLFVVCELPADKCDPVNNPKAEIANFGWSNIEGEWKISGTTLYKLVPSK